LKNHSTVGVLLRAPAYYIEIPLGAAQVAQNDGSGKLGEGFRDVTVGVADRTLPHVQGNDYSVPCKGWRGGNRGGGGEDARAKPHCHPPFSVGIA
jgi:hypothetical protein